MLGAFRLWRTFGNCERERMNAVYKFNIIVSIDVLKFLCQNYKIIRGI